MLTRPDGPALAVHEDGPRDGPPVVLVHGLALSHRSWEWLVPELVEEGCRVVRPDLRGHGGSEAAPGAYHLAGYVSDVVGVLERVVGGPALLVGHSLGGLTVAAVAQQRPELVRGLLLEDPSLGLARPARGAPEGPVADDLRASEAAGGRDADLGHIDDLAAEIGATRTSSGETAGERYAADAVLARAHGRLHVDVAAIAPVTDPRPDHLGTGFDAESPVPVATTVLTADPSSPERVTSRGDEARLTGASPAVRWHAVPGAGHWVHDTAEHRPVVVAHLRELLAETRA